MLKIAALYANSSLGFVMENACIKVFWDSREIFSVTCDKKNVNTLQTSKACRIYLKRGYVLKSIMLVDGLVGFIICVL